MRMSFFPTESATESSETCVEIDSVSSSSPLVFFFVCDVDALRARKCAYSIKMVKSHLLPGRPLDFDGDG